MLNRTNLSYEGCWQGSHDVAEIGKKVGTFKDDIGGLLKDIRVQTRRADSTQRYP